MACDLVADIDNTPGLWGGSRLRSDAGVASRTLAQGRPPKRSSG